MDTDEDNLKEKLQLSCRLCLNLDEEMRSLFPSELVQQLTECTGIKIHPHPQLPSNICSSCTRQLKDFHAFFTKCHSTHNYLKSLIYDDFDIKEEMGSDSNYDPLVSDDEILSNLSKRNGNVTINVDKSEDHIKIVEIENFHSLVTDVKKSFKLKKKSKRLMYSSDKIENKLDKRKELIKCSICGLMFKDLSALSSHLEKHNKDITYICSLCNRHFSSKSSLKLHMTRIHLNKQEKTNSRQTCENCGKTFSSNKNLKIHMRIHTGEMPYECTICLRRFTQIGTLISHKRVHTGEKPYVCKLCGRAFSEHTHLRRHQSVHSEDKPFICNICGKGFKSYYALMRHTKSHTNEKEHVCDQCGLSFTAKGNLDQHTRVKHSEKSGQCDICNKIFPNLKTHIVVHTGEKPFKCNLCDKKFALKRGLVIHNRQHTHANKYKCDIEDCGRTFSARWILDCHIKKHTGHMPYTCKYCSKSYPRICHLTQHLKLIHPNEDQNSMSFIGDK